MASSVRTLISSIALATAAATTAADPTNFRVGVAGTQLNIDPGPEYVTSSDDTGIAIFAEYPQSNHAASRFIVYRIHDDGSDTGNDRKDVTGFETQLMWGWGLAKPGFRIYTGPAWHREKMLVERSGKYKTRTLNGWGWQLGLGYQLGPITLDAAATWRDPDDYRLENQRTAALSDDTPDVIFNNLMISYRF